jgi:thiamine-phosphate pyrophosphorylase
MPTEPLPELHLITPPPVLSGEGGALFLAQLEAVLQKGIRLVQLRAPELDTLSYRWLFEQAQARCCRYDARLLVNTTAEEAVKLGAAGLPLSSERLMACASRPLGPGYLVSAACHDEQQLQHAEQIGVDFAMLSPVLPTTTHPQARPLGWYSFAELTSRSTIPVYALGGLGRDDLDQVKRAGGHGVAGVSQLWGS